MHRKKKVLIGCSGYYYTQWKKDGFYPPGVPASQWLEYYSSIFNTVELNGTFYKIPSLKQLEKYAANTAAGFKFSVKMNKQVTHVLKLKDTKEMIHSFTTLIQEGLGAKLDKILFQMPPSFHFNEENVSRIFSNIPQDALYVIEFRHSSWWNDEATTIFKPSGYTICNIDFPGLEQHFYDNGSKPFYLRLHGTPELFKSSYSDHKLREIAGQIPGDCKSYHIYFNNTFYDAGYKNAKTLIGIIKQG